MLLGGQVEPWDVDWAHEQAVRPWSGWRGTTRSAAAHKGSGSTTRPPTRPPCVPDRDAYLEALRSYCRAGRDEALRIRKGAA
jgi:hypothetical protein